MLNKIKKDQRGLTLIEVIVVFGIALMLFGILLLNSSRFASRSDLISNTDKLASDLRSQQTKAMLGATEGRATADSYGIYFLPDQYVLFHGTSYNANDTSNFVVELGDNQEIEGTTFPNDIVIFSALSGEIVGFSPGSNTVTLRTLDTNQENTFTLNQYGVITQIE